jgi:ATP-dependent RNA helicase DDX1
MRSRGEESGHKNPYSCCVLGGAKSPDLRRAALESFKDGSVRFLICTDLAARGIDVKNLPFVINMTLPDESEQYIHRIGRVGRAERLGLAISIVGPLNAKEKVWYHSNCSNKGRDGCTNRTLVENGGCCIWYDETELLGLIEERLQETIEEMGPEYSLPAHLSGNLSDYGEEVKVEAPAVNSRLLALGPTVRELAEMEVQAQNSFLSMQSIFNSSF